MADKIKRYKTGYKRFIKDRSNDYQQYGRYLVRDCTLNDIPLRFISFIGDLAAMAVPIIIWDFLFILVGGGLIPYPIFKAFTWVMTTAIIISTLLVNTYLIVAFKGQTFGKLALNFKIVSQDDNKALSTKYLLIREVLGIEIPLLILVLLFGIVGAIGFFAINGLFVIFDKNHRSIADLIIKSKIVILNEKGQKHKFVVPEEEKEEKEIASENLYDLHVYSSFSHDGEMEVEDIFKKAKDSGIKVLSICDHNSVKANNIAQKLAPLYNITYIPGINIDCNYKGHDLRLLGYFINSNDDRYIQIEYENLAKEKAVSARRIELFEEFSGFLVNQEKLLLRNRFQIISPEMVARQILSIAEYRKTKLLQPYLSGAKKDRPVGNFVKDFFGPGAPAYMPVIHPKLEDMVALIKASGGVSVLAHPMHSLRDNIEILDEIIQTGIEGLELFTPYHSNKDIKYLIQIAKQYGLDISEGSEYHGPSKPNFILGKTRCPKDVEEVVFKFIEKHRTL